MTFAPSIAACPPILLLSISVSYRILRTDTSRPTAPAAAGCPARVPLKSCAKLSPHPANSLYLYGNSLYIQCHVDRKPLPSGGDSGAGTRKVSHRRTHPLLLRTGIHRIGKRQFQYAGRGTGTVERRHLLRDRHAPPHSARKTAPLQGRHTQPISIHPVYGQLCDRIYRKRHRTGTPDAGRPPRPPGATHRHCNSSWGW